MPPLPDSPAALPNDLLSGMAAQGGVKRYAAHTVIISEGDMADSQIGRAHV